ncbi:MULTISPECIES: FecCD family ABC transporter permease [Micrococcales]|uniref:FecCD family ABC transporter permease n=1 Tax=Micrococcales TaxID=85006 RepID=UPI0004AB1A24|nr:MULTISPECIES: iron ABC transporter permease [Micrococcales]
MYRRPMWLLGMGALSLVTVLASLYWGSHALPVGEVTRALSGSASSLARTILWEQRIPRTILGVACGMALGLAGSLMQTLTRNPLAEPGILGLNAGAAAAVVLLVVVTGSASLPAYMLAAWVGASVTAALAFSLGGGAQRNVVRLILAGIGLSAALMSLTEAMILANHDAFDEFRVWIAGSLEGRGLSVVAHVVPVQLVGVLLALSVTRSLHALALGDEVAISLGVSVQRTRTVALVAVALLSATTTAAIGPIAFVGLAVPYVVRSVLGNDVRWVNVGSIILGPAWVLGADVVARVILAPQEAPVGVLATLLGAPLFVALMMRRRVLAL